MIKDQALSMSIQISIIMEWTLWRVGLITNDSHENIQNSLQRRVLSI